MTLLIAFLSAKQTDLTPGPDKVRKANHTWKALLAGLISAAAMYSTDNKSQGFQLNNLMYTRALFPSFPSACKYSVGLYLYGVAVFSQNTCWHTCVHIVGFLYRAGNVVKGYS